MNHKPFRKTFILLPFFLLAFHSLMAQPHNESMADILGRMAAESNNQQFFYRKSVEQYRNTNPTTSTFYQWVSYCNVLVRDGDMDEAAIIIDKLDKYAATYPLESGSNSQSPYRMYQLVSALYNLRRAELTNCQLNHNALSCIFPFHPQGVHLQTEGAEKALANLQNVLRLPTPETDANREKYRWLVNVLNSAIGKYPTSVPSAQLLLINKYDHPYPQGEFRNVAGYTGTDINGWYGGVCAEDFNRDGFIDLFVTNGWLDRRPALLISNGAGGFVDRTEESGLSAITGGANANMVDYNNDGNIDIYIMRGGWLYEHGAHPNSLLRNNGDGTFTDVTVDAGLLHYAPSQTAAWADINNDGFADLFEGNECCMNPSPSCHYPSHLYLNMGNGTFREMSAEAGINIDTIVKGCVWADFNNDLLPDLYVSIYGGANRLYINRGNNKNGIPRFEEMAATAGVAEPLFSFPTAAFDFDNDGNNDILVMGYLLDDYDQIGGFDYVSGFLNRNSIDACSPRLYRNNGNLTFTDITTEAGLNRNILAMSLNVGDINNDGYLDFYTGTGDPDLLSLYPNLLFINDAGKRFLDVTTATATGHLQKGHAIAFADFDNDGDVDIYASLGGATYGDSFRNALFENPGSVARSLQFTLIGTRSNRSSIGARIHLTLKDTTGVMRHIYRQVSTGGSYGANSFRQHIGLGNSSKIVSLEVNWTSGAVSTFNNLQPGKHYTFSEGNRNAIEKTLVPFQYSGYFPAGKTKCH